jgi:hypothetical protein
MGIKGRRVEGIEGMANIPGVVEDYYECKNQAFVE